MGSDLPLVVSLDDHVVEPPDLWYSRLPKRYRDRAPRVERRRVGGVSMRGGDITSSDLDSETGAPADVWVYEDLAQPYFRTGAAVGYDRDDMAMVPMTYDEMRPGCYDPTERLVDMDINGVEASMCFPNLFVRFCGQTFLEAKDKELALRCVQTYNDWMIEDWAGPSGGRLIPLGIIPLWDPQLCAAEVRRVADRGCRAVCFSELPTNLGLPSIHNDHWRPFFDACADTGTRIAIHFGSGSKLAATSDDAPQGVVPSLTFVNPAKAMVDWLTSGWFVRLPDLKVLLAECQIGWIPYLLERMDNVWSDARAYAEVDTPEPPSTYFRSNVYVTFFKDEHGMRSIDEIGLENCMFETDYPHVDSTWPETPSIVKQIVAELGPEKAEAVVRGNAIKLMGLS